VCNKISIILTTKTFTILKYLPKYLPNNIYITSQHGNYAREVGTFVKHVLTLNGHIPFEWLNANLFSSTEMQKKFLCFMYHFLCESWGISRTRDHFRRWCPNILTKYFPNQSRLSHFNYLL
jgi:hypothetical protein